VKAKRSVLSLWASQAAGGSLWGALAHALLRLVWFGIGWGGLSGWGWTAANGAIIGALLGAALCAVRRHAWLVGAGGSLIAAAAAVLGHIAFAPQSTLVWLDRTTFLFVARRAFAFEFSASALTCIVILTARSVAAVPSARTSPVEERESVKTCG
jgi:hypothetical protein